MMFPFRRKSAKDKAKDAFFGLSLHETHLKRKLPGARYRLRAAALSAKKAARAARYAAEDAAFFLRKIPRHTESLLFVVLITLAGAMLAGSRAGSFLDSLVAFLLLVLIVVLYGQLKMQRRMLAQYVPMVDFVRVRECRLYSDRIRAVNIFGVREKLPKVKMVRNVRIKYDIINDSFCPVSIEGVGLLIKIKKGGKISLPPAVSVVDVAPKATGSTTAEFRLRDEIPFGAIEWLEIDLRGNCRRKERVKPHLYVNAMLEGSNPRPIFEPYEAFLKRPELQEQKGMPESK
jgi:hypothetical protein